MRKLWLLLKGTLADLFTSGPLDYSCWIFSSTDNSAYNYNSKYLIEYVREQFPEIRAYYVVNDADKRTVLTEKYGNYFFATDSWRGMKKALHAGVWLSSAGMPVYSLLNKANNKQTGKKIYGSRIIVNLWHGIPLKKIALEEERCSPLERMYFSFIFSPKYTYVLTTSHALLRVMSKSFGVSEKKVKIWGQPRNDELLHKALPKDSAADLEALSSERVDANLKTCISRLPFHRKLILYAPTYRENEATQLFPFKDFSQKRLEQWLEEKQCAILICKHISESGRFKDYCGDRVEVLDDIEDITCCLPYFDMLITDYSSIFIDYLLLQRPMLFLPYDQKEYLAKRGFNFDYDTVSPGPKPETFESFLLETEHLLDADKYYAEERSRVNRFFNEIQSPCCGNICKKIIKEIERRTHEKSNHVRNI